MSKKAKKSEKKKSLLVECYFTITKFILYLYFWYIWTFIKYILREEGKREKEKVSNKNNE